VQTENKDAAAHPTKTIGHDLPLQIDLIAILVVFNYMVIWDIMILDTPPHWPHTFIVYFLAMLVLPECIEKQRGHFDAG